MSAFDDFLADPGAERAWLLEIDALSLAPISDGTQSACAYVDMCYGELAYGEGDGNESGGITTLYYSSHGFTSKSTDTPADTYYDASLAGDILIDRRIFGRGGVAGLTRVLAECALVNADGALDDVLTNYAIDGRGARLRIGRPANPAEGIAGDARADYGLLFSGVVADTPAAGMRQLRLKLSDGLARLDVPVNTTNYAGTGGLEGGADLAGKPKPKCWGNVKNVSAPLVNSALLIYQANDAAISDVPMVYDRQIALTQGADYSSQADMENNAPAAGYYRVWKAGGFFRLGATPAGTVTADVLGDANGGYVNKTADIVQRILLNQVGMDSSEIDAASFAQLNVDAPAEVGDCTSTDVVSAAAVIDRLLAGVGAWGGFSRLGKFNVGRVAAASGAAVASYTKIEILDLERQPLPLGPVVWLARVAWQRNYTVQTDVAAAVLAARRTFAAQAERVAFKQNLAAKSQRPLAQAYEPLGDLYAQEADANTEAQRRIDLWSADRKFFRVVLPAVALHRDLGEVVNITHDRHGLSAGADARILAHSIKGTKTELMVLI